MFCILKLVCVRSTSIEAVDFDSVNEVLIIKFKNSSKVYKYKNVSKCIFENLMSSTSKGRFFIRYIKGKYKFEKIYSRGQVSLIGVAPFFPKKVTKYEFSPIKIVVSNIRLYHYFYDLIEPAYFLYYLI